jgi:TatD DNase family protein
VIDELETRPIKGAVLHWWLGDAHATERAVKCGAYFSVNASSLRHRDVLQTIPIDRLLLETDHQFGDRYAALPRRPGATEDIEHTLAYHFNTDHSAIRRTMWRNLARLVDDVGCIELLPQRVGRILAALK